MGQWSIKNQFFGQKRNPYSNLGFCHEILYLLKLNFSLYEIGAMV